jgi:hypothetical protein
MTTRKTKRVLSDISFEGKDAHLALVSKKQGGPANGADYKLVIKSAKYTDEIVEKASKIRITMSITDFLQRYFNMYYEDSFVLAQALGFDTTPDDEEDVETYQDYIDARVSAIEVIKALEQAEDINKSLSELEPESYLALLKSQELLEKAFKKIDKGTTNSKPVVQTTTLEKGEVTAVVQTKEVATKNVEASPSNEQTITEKSKMTVKTVEQEVLVEMVEKSQFESIEKALEKQTLALEKALASVAQFEKEKAEAIQKSRKDLLKTTVKDDEKVEALIKGLANVDSEETFQGVIKALEAMLTVQKNSDLFKELGASSEQVEVKEQETPLMKATKAAVAKAKSLK